MTDATDGITLYAYTRADTPAAAGTLAVSQIADLYEFGLIGPGSSVWCNLEIPNAMWVLSDVSTYLQLIDVPFAGWARLTQKEVAWARAADDTGRTPSHTFGLADMPIPFQDNDICTVAYRNSDPEPMRAQFNGKHHHLDDFVIAHSNVRVVDLKTRGVGRRCTPIGQPSVIHSSHAMQRGLALLTAGCTKNSSGVARRRTIVENFEAFGTVISADDLNRIRALQQRLDQAAQSVTDPIIQRVSELKGFGPAQRDERREDAFAFRSAAGE